MQTTTTSTGKTCKPVRIPEAAKFSLDQLQAAQDKNADQYDKKIWFDQHVLGVARLRKKLFSKATGKILDVACGTGLNFAVFAPGSDVTAVDLSPNMIEVARRNPHARDLHVKFHVMDAEHLVFPDESFDTIASALSTCTFPDPVRALQEMKRVCRPGGLILLLEHGHSNWLWLARYQDRHEYAHYEAHAGCRWNQDPVELVESAGLKVKRIRRSVLGIYYSIEAIPLKSGELT
jgi:ubiquinone/menaquinone biosynthesis C-methylase UbiE